MNNKHNKYECVIIGGSAGAFLVISQILENLKTSFTLPIIIVQHINNDTDYYFIEHYRRISHREIVLVDNMADIKDSTIFVAPADYHLLVENKKLLVLSNDEKVRYSRPSIDVLFESASEVFSDSLISIILTGANNDGSFGSECVNKQGGCTIAQDPQEAKFQEMPKQAIEKGCIDKVLKITKIIDFLNNLNMGESDVFTEES